MSRTQETGRAYALLADGTTVEIRPAEPDDFGAVKAMHQAMSPDNAYLRFFNFSRLAPEAEARRTCREPGPDHGALLALLALSAGARSPVTYLRGRDSDQAAHCCRMRR